MQKKCLIISLIASIFFSATNAQIEVNSSESEIQIEYATQVTNETWQSAPSIKFNGVALKDQFMCGFEDLEIAGEFRGDLWGASFGVNYIGNSDRNVRFAAFNNVTIEGEIQKNLIAIVPNFNNATIKLTEQSEILGSTFLFGENVIIQGTTGDATIYANKATIGGKISGDLKIVANDIVILNNTQISGDLNYLSATELFAPPSAKIGGEIKAIPAPIVKNENGFLTKVYLFFATVLVAIPFFKFFPNYAGISAATFRFHPWRCLITGLISLFAVPIFCISLCASLIGLPLGLIIAAMYGIIVYLSEIIFGLIIGIVIFKHLKFTAPKNAILPGLAGLAVFLS